MRSYCRPLSDPWLRADLPGPLQFSNISPSMPPIRSPIEFTSNDAKRNSPGSTNYATFQHFSFLSPFFLFFFFISSLFFEYTAKRNDETTRCAQFRHVLIDQFQYSNSDEPPQYLTFNPFAEKNCYRWIDCGVYECTTIKQFFVNFERRVRILLEKNFFFYRRLLFKTFQVKYL